MLPNSGNVDEIHQAGTVASASHQGTPSHAVRPAAAAKVRRETWPGRWMLV